MLQSILFVAQTLKPKYKSGKRIILGTQFILAIMVKDVIKFSIKAGVALFILGLGTKIGKDAIEHLKDIQNEQKNLKHGE